MIKVLLQSQPGIKREHSNAEDERKGNSLESFHQDDRILPSSFHGGQTTLQRRLNRLLSRVRQQARLMSWLKTPCLFQSHFRKSFPPAHFFPTPGRSGRVQDTGDKKSTEVLLLVWGCGPQQKSSLLPERRFTGRVNMMKWKACRGPGREFDFLLPRN